MSSLKELLEKQKKYNLAVVQEPVTKQMEPLNNSDVEDSVTYTKSKAIKHRSKGIKKMKKSHKKSNRKHKKHHKK